jgi:hypothetical protein
MVWAAAIAGAVAAGPVGAATGDWVVPAHAAKTVATESPATQVRRGIQESSAPVGKLCSPQAIVHALLSRGIDPTDERAVQDFIDSVNAEGGIDALG